MAKRKATTTRATSSLSRSRTARLHWLVENMPLLDDVPSDSQDVTDENRSKLETLSQTMTTVGLYINPPNREHLWGLRVLVGQARRRALQAAR